MPVILENVLRNAIEATEGPRASVAQEATESATEAERVSDSPGSREERPSSGRLKESVADVTGSTAMERRSGGTKS
mgnify:CR=1 FL=1